MIKVENLRKKFTKIDKEKKKTEFYAVDNISFEAKERRNCWNTTVRMVQEKLLYLECL